MDTELDDPLADEEVVEADLSPLMQAPPLTVPQANQNLTDIRIELRAAYDLQRLLRQRVQQTLAAWMRATVRTPTADELLRQHIQNEQRNRAEGIRPRPPEQRRLGSKIDQFAYYTKNHGRTTGGGRSFARPLVEGQKVFGPAFHGRDLTPKE